MRLVDKAEQVDGFAIIAALRRANEKRNAIPGCWLCARRASDHQVRSVRRTDEISLRAMGP
jgi:hypothetical protein